MEQKLIVLQIDKDELLKELVERITPFVNTNQKEKALDPLLTCKEVEEHFDISPPTRIEWSRNGFLKQHAIGSRIYYKMSEVEAALIPIE